MSRRRQVKRLGRMLDRVPYRSPFEALTDDQVLRALDAARAAEPTPEDVVATLRAQPEDPRLSHLSDEEVLREIEQLRQQLYPNNEEQS
jgi:hypothetical protein